MKRILYIATSNIFVNTGGGIANRAFMNALMESYPGQVDVVHMQTDKSGTLPANFVMVPALSKTAKLHALFTGKIHRYNPWVLNYLDKHPGEYSHCIINCGDLGDIVPEIKKRGIKVAVIHHNYEVEFQMDNRRPSTFWGLCPTLVKHNERKSYKNADINLFLTSSDKDRFIQEYGEAGNVPNRVVGIFEAEEKELNNQIESTFDTRKLVICGSLNSVQTLKGIKDFSSKYLHLLHHYYKDNFKLTITGRSPGKYIQELALSDANIHLVPSPQNISNVVKESGIFICPTNVGGGIKLRIMDGLKLGMPIITHQVSARGYDKFFDKPWFKIYDDKSSFMKALEEINIIIKNEHNLRAIILKEYRDYFSYSCGKIRFLDLINDYLSSSNC